MANDFTPFAKRLGKRGGEKILKKYGRKHFKKMAEARWSKTKKD